ncbi:uncharacterized protein LOC125939667 isoform X1 [Dermacentor silvarum]|uniref:uncharacterized protein LOC125939667 isoform X1 n=2 Tax=Dermacentor silvarum TaxID=543639 RepID=UPI00210105AC|nr:uncharacterized protein LOC125939667 isoform X1 [Dermacentor silvarum]
MMPLVKDRIVHSPFPDVDIPECTLYNFIATFLKRYADKIAFVEGDESMSYAFLQTRLRQYAMGFHKHGVRRGDRFIVAVDNTTDALISILALMFSGCVACFASGPRTSHELVYQVKDAEASFCLTDSDNLAYILDEQHRCRFKMIFVMRDTPGFVSVVSFRKLPEMSLLELQEEDTKKALCAIAYTSGTTGDAKGVMVSQYSFVAAIQSVRAMKCAGENEVLIVLWSLYSVSAIRLFMDGLCNGGTSVIVKPKHGSAKIIEAIKKHNVTMLCGSATPLQRLVREAFSAGEALKSVKCVGSIGGTLPESAVEQMRSVFDLRKLGHTYGLTEAAGIVLAPPFRDVTVAYLGYACPGVLIKVVDVVTREPLPAEKSGEICVKIPSVMMGYLNKPEVTKQVFDSEGWLLSGDCGYYDERGRLHYIDRLKDTIKCRGFHVPTPELEQLIGSMAEVSEVAVVGVPSAEYQDAPIAFIVPKPPAVGNAALALKIKQHVAAKTPSHMHLYGGVVFTDSLPRNEIGKVLKRELRKIAADKDTVKL